ncbi:MAG: sigma-70 family RNA polymerase sigma factor [Gammaproteobacteria bacterium]|nr:sigma-70 family RNA polymerase sigma factor [Gammaproteobacteria bacterium]
MENRKQLAEGWGNDRLNGTDERDDQELIANANAGDASAFEGLYFRYRDWVVNLAFRFTGDREQALDILQEVFLYFLKKFPGFRLTCQLKSFLYPVVKNLSLNARAKAERWRGGEELFAELEAPRGQEASGEALRVAVAGLPEAQRETLVLRFVEGMELAEIAAALEVPLGTVKSRLHHGLAALRGNPKLREFF